jgi:hypothetical protein
VRRELRPF